MSEKNFNGKNKIAEYRRKIWPPMTQREAANKIGVDKKQWQRWEKNVVQPRYTKHELIAALLKIQSKKLFLYPKKKKNAK